MLNYVQQEKNLTFEEVHPIHIPVKSGKISVASWFPKGTI